METNDRLVNVKEASTIIGLSKSWLAKDRMKNDNALVPFVRLTPKCIRYRFSDLQKKIQQAHH